MVTLTPTLPALAGAVAVIVVGEITVNWEDSFGPKYTALASLNPLPLMMTVAPPPADTASGDSEVTSGAPGVDPGPGGNQRNARCWGRRGGPPGNDASKLPVGSET